MSTERNKASEALRLNQEQAALVADLLERSSQPFAVGYPDGGMYIVNAAYSALTGYSKDELKEINWNRVLTPPEWQETEQKELEKLTVTGQPVRYQKEYIRKDGSRVPVEVLAHLVRDDQGQPQFYYAFVTDITRCKQAEKALLEKTGLAQQISIIAGNAPGALYSFRLRPDGTTSFPYVSPAWEDLSGLKQEDVLNDASPIYKFIHPEDVPHIQNTIRDSAQNMDDWKAEFRILNSDKGEIWVEGHSTPVLEPDGSILWHGFITDINDRKRAEESIILERDFSNKVLDSLPGIFYLFDEEGKFIRWNSNLEHVTGYSADEISRMTALDFFTGDDKTQVLKRIQETFATGYSDVEADLVTKAGKRIPYYLTGRIIHINGKARLIGMGMDIAERKRAEAAAKVSTDKFRAMVEVTSDWVWEVDECGVYTYASPKVRDILGYEPEEMLGKSPFDLMPPDDSERVAGFFRDIVTSGRPFSLLENVNLHKNGSRVVLETSGVPFFDSAGKFKGYRGIDRDITERKRAEETIKYQAYHDLLTGLPNRSLFVDLVNRELPHMQRAGMRLAIMTLGIDNFKKINDSLGYEAGDKLIKDVAGLLKTSTREADTVARIGGDKFTIMLPLITQPDEDSSRVAGKVMNVFNKPFTIGKNEFHITVSIGISLYPEDGDNAEVLLKNSEIALYHAKDEGRNNYQFFNAAQNIRTIEHVLFENRLRRAIENGEMVVYYQPQIDIKTQKIVGAEALVRWNHPELGLLKPAEFIPLAEEIGVIAEIDQWVLRTACMQIRAWQESGRPLRFITVNLSARQFQQHNLAEKVSEALGNAGLNPESLGCEITETIAMRDTEVTFRSLESLNTMGIKFSIDDFGTGYSSLSYLKKFPIHKLKIDKSFISGLSMDTDFQAIVVAIIAMAHALKLTVLAEGVETEEQMRFLRLRDCDEIQGYLFSKPVPAEEFEALMS
jgi:diguanylate cyclase (GGDEF)-like protein/PAS domain S-box-containing protein